MCDATFGVKYLLLNIGHRRETFLMWLLAWSIKSLLLKAAVRHIWALLLRQGPWWSDQMENKRCHVGEKYQPTRKTDLLLSLNATSCLKCKWNQSAKGALSCFPFVIFILIITRSCGGLHPPPPPHALEKGIPHILTRLELKLCCSSKPAQAKMVIGEFLCLLLWTLSCVISVVIIVVVRHSVILWLPKNKANLAFRWEKEDKGGWQRSEPCLEWGN